MNKRLLPWLALIGCTGIVYLVYLKTSVDREPPVGDQTQLAPQQAENAVVPEPQPVSREREVGGTPERPGESGPAGLSPGIIRATHEPFRTNARASGAGGAALAAPPSTASDPADLKSKLQPEPGAEILTYPTNQQALIVRRFSEALEKLATFPNKIERYRALDEAAKDAFLFGRIEDARGYANELLTLAATMDVVGFKNEQAIHDGNLVLGRIAVREGRIDDAKQNLLDAGKTEGSPVLNNFGPNMTLAEDLLERGERDSVLKYFELCRAFWKMGGDKLDQWIQDVQAGKMPDFGANLFY